MSAIKEFNANNINHKVIQFSHSSGALLPSIASEQPWCLFKAPALLSKIPAALRFCTLNNMWIIHWVLIVFSPFSLLIGGEGATGRPWWRLSLWKEGLKSWYMIWCFSLREGLAGRLLSVSFFVSPVGVAHISMWHILFILYSLLFHLHWPNCVIVNNWVN